MASRSSAATRRPARRGRVGASGGRSLARDQARRPHPARARRRAARRAGDHLRRPETITRGELEASRTAWLARTPASAPASVTSSPSVCRTRSSSTSPCSRPGRSAPCRSRSPTGSPPPSATPSSTSPTPSWWSVCPRASTPAAPACLPAIDPTPRSTRARCPRSSRPRCARPPRAGARAVPSSIVTGAAAEVRGGGRRHLPDAARRRAARPRAALPQRPLSLSTAGLLIGHHLIVLPKFDAVAALDAIGSTR